MLSLTSPIKTPWHRLSPGPKLAALALVSIGLGQTQDPILLGGAVIGVAALYLPGGIAFCSAGLRALRPLLIFVVFLAIYHVWTGEIVQGAAILFRLVAAVGLANLVTMTTRLDDLMALITRLLRPFSPTGQAGRILGVVVALFVRFIPILSLRASQLSEGWRARSRKRPGWRLIMPLTLAALDDAEQVSEALRARGGFSAHTEKRK